RFQITRLRRRLRPFEAPDQNAKFVAADAADDIGRPYMADQLPRNRFEQRITGAVAIPVVDYLESVEVDEHQDGLRAVALDMSERPLELTLEAAPVEDVEQRIDVGARLKLADAGARDSQFALEAFNLGKQRSNRWKLIIYTWLRKTHVSALVSVRANLNRAPKNTPFTLPVGGPDL